MPVDQTPSPTAENARRTVRVEVWSDVVCPWCYIGKRRFATGLEQAREQLASAGIDADFDVSYHPFQLDPTAAPGVAGPVIDAYAKKFGGIERAEAIIANVSATAADVGLEFDMARALRANTLLAHRLIWWAGQASSPIEQADMKERLLEAYFVDGLHIGDPHVLADCAAELGADRDDVMAFLASDGGRAEVDAELASAHDNGITAVPTYVIDGRWAIPGAQEPETFAKVLTKMAAQDPDEPG
jgi:predicted DsbA family dithiol-disulfide isomerase